MSLLQPLLSSTRKSTVRRLRAVDAGEPVHEARPALLDLEVRRQLLRDLLGVGEGVLLGVLLEEEVERVDHRHVGDQVDLDGELRRPLEKDEPREIVAERVLLPVDEVLLGRDLQRVGLDRRAAMRRRPQAHDMRRQHDRSVVAV